MRNQMKMKINSKEFVNIVWDVLVNCPRDTKRYELKIDWEVFSINDCIKKFEEHSWCRKYHADWFAILFDTLREKNADYSPFDDAFANFRMCETLWVSVEDWIKVRICDKVSRLRNLRWWREPEVKEESLADTYLDLAWYLTLLYIWLNWDAFMSETLYEDK